MFTLYHDTPRGGLSAVEARHGCSVAGQMKRSKTMKSESTISGWSNTKFFAGCLVLFQLAACSAWAATEQWQGIPGISATTNWSDPLNWTSPQQTYYNQVQFTGTGASPNTDFSINNVLDGTGGVSQMPIWELDYVPVNSNYTTLIDPGVTLTLDAGNGKLVIGADQLNTANPAPANAFETITITGPGATLSMDGTLFVNQGSPTSGDTHNVTLDLSGLANFIDNGGGQANEILVASGGAERTHGTLYLALTNEIVLGDDFLICNQTFSNSEPCAVYLGITNSILIGTGNLTIGGTGTTTVGAWMKFNPAFLGGATPPAATLGGTDSDGRIVNFWICNANGGPQVAGYGLCDLSGGTVSLMAHTMQLGQGGNPGANALGVLTLDNGIINVNNASIGNQEVSGGGTGVGVVNLNTNATYATNATLTVNNTLTLGAATGAVTAGSGGTINVDGGMLAAGNIVQGGGAANINLTNGTLALTGLGGSLAAPLTVLTAVNSTFDLAVLHAATNVVVASLTTGGPTNIINITSVPASPSYPITVTLLKYSGSIGGAGFNFGVGTLPPLCAGYISNDTANSAVDLVLTSGPLTDTWTGAINGNWDTTTANWKSGGPVTYAEGAFVQFLDGASIGTVDLTTNLEPGGIIVSNNALNYTFDGTGELSGSTSLLKEGSGTLVIDNSGLNAFDGGVTIDSGTIQVGTNDANGSLPNGTVADNGALVFDRSDNPNYGGIIAGTGSVTQEGAGGTLRLSGANTFTGAVLVTNGSILQLGSGSALGAGGAGATIANGSTLDANGYSATKTLFVSGTGVNGNGVLTDSGGSIYDNPGPGLATNIILTGDATFTYPTRWDLGSSDGGSVLGTDGNPHDLTLNSSVNYIEWNNLSVLPPLANINIAAGNLGVVGSTTFGDTNATLAIYPSAQLTIYGASVVVNKNVDFQNGATIDNAYGANTMNGIMTLEPGTGTVIVGGGTTLTLNDVLTGSGVFYQTTGTGTTILNGDSPSFTGGIALYNGQITLNGSIGGGITNFADTILAGSGSAGGPVDLSGAFYPGGVGTPGTFTAGGGLTLESSATLTMDLAPSLGGASDLIAVTGNLTVNGNNISLNPISGTLADGTYPLFTYTGSLSGTFGTASTVAASRYTFTINTSTPGQVNLVVTGTADVLEWNNGANNGQWDVQSSYNWSNLTAHTEDQFYTGDTVVLDDSISLAANPTTTLNIGSGVVVAPGALTNNSTTNYTITGAGMISGGASMVKLGSSTLNINTTNNFTGNFIIGAGAVQMNTPIQSTGSGVGAANGTLFITNGASLLLNLQGGYPGGDGGFGTKPIVVSGAGVNGNGAIQNIGNPLYDDSSTLGLGQNVTLAGNTTLGGTVRWDWGYPGYNSTLSTRGSNFNLTIIEPSYSQWNTLLIDTNLGNMDFYSTATSQQTWSVSGMGRSLGNPTNVLTLHSNALMDIGHGSTAASDSGYAKVIHVLPTAAFEFAPGGGAGDYRLATSFETETNSELSFYNGNGGSNSGTVINGTVTLNGLTHLSIGDSTVTFSNVISGAGGFYWDTYNNAVVFTATNTYTGITDIRSGRVLALVGNGSIFASTNISLAASATLDVSARSDQSLTLASGQTLQGSGIVDGNLSVGSGAVVAPGGTGTIGTLTVTNAVVLSGALDMEVSGATSDQISGAASITYGGTLNVGVLSGTLAGGDTFKLFSAGSYSGSFSSIAPAIPGPGLTWDTSQLTVNGTLGVTGAALPTFGFITLSQGQLVFSGGNGVANQNFYVLATTNLALPSSNWIAISTNSFNASGNFNFTNNLGTNTAQEFYKLQIP
jgi:fibronectin-binding autotransporter adhesin